MKNQSVILIFSLLCHTLILPVQINGQFNGNNEDSTVLKSTVEMKSLQYNSNRGEFQIHAPNTYALAKYGDLPVDHSTGIPNINIPLLSIADKDVEATVSLSYHAGGIKVDEEATWVGLGWSLNAGGMITRIIKGRPDEPNINGKLSYTRTNFADYSYPGSLPDYCISLRTVMFAAATDQYDNEADIFYFNFCGNIGKFFFDADMKPIFSTYKDYKIQYKRDTSAGNSYFIITDEKGINYEFRQCETTYFYNDYQSHITGWYMTKISSPSGGVINFSYTSGGVTNNWYQKRKYDACFMGVNILSNTPHLIQYPYNNNLLNRNSSISGVVLTQISTASGRKVVFTKGGFTRLDAEVDNTHVLTAVTLYDSNNSQQKKYIFNYSHFEANNSHKYNLPPAGSGTFLNYRLRLDSFREVSSSGTQLPPYIFEYFGDNNPATNDEYTLPYRLSPSQDHWGYYNFSNNTNIFPNNPSDISFRMDGWFLECSPDNEPPYIRNVAVTGGGNRNPHQEAIKAGSLKKITYPTGGTTEFNYDTFQRNIISHPSMGSLRIRTITDNDGKGNMVVKSYDYSPFYPVYGPDSWESLYHTFFFRYFTPSGNPAAGAVDFMMAFGIPAEFADKEYVLRINGSPTSILGASMSGIYTSVTERISGNGRAEYEFDTDEDLFGYGGDSGGWNGVNVPGMLNSAYVILYHTDPSVGRTYTYWSRSANIHTFPYPDPVVLDWRRGHLKEKRIYNESNQEVERTTFTYDIKAINAVPGYKVRALSSEAYIYARYYNIGGMSKIKKEVTKMYVNGTLAQETTKEYAYMSSSHKQLTESKLTDSKGTVLTTRYYYPTEYDNISNFSILKNNHILLPVDIRKYNGTKLVNGEQIQYNNYGQPLQYFQAEPTGNDIVFNRANAYTFTPDKQFVYNTQNLLQSQITRDGLGTVYLWGYNRQYPIAEIKNVTYSQVTGFISESTLNSISSKIEPSASDMTLINGLRTKLTDSHIITYTYKPLIGMTSKTDSNGVISYYEYDSFGRLRYIKDHNGKIIEQYDYHYKP